MPVATKTQSVTNTKLALATAALLAASGLALAFLPGSGLGEKCGVNTARYASDRACPGGSSRLDVLRISRRTRLLSYGQDRRPRPIERERTGARGRHFSRSGIHTR